MNNPECKRCGLLKNTVDSTQAKCIPDKRMGTVLEGVHEFDVTMKTFLEKELERFDDKFEVRKNGRKLLCEQNALNLIFKSFLKESHNRLLEEIEGKTESLRQYGGVLGKTKLHNEHNYAIDEMVKILSELKSNN